MTRVYLSKVLKGQNPTRKNHIQNFPKLITSKQHPGTQRYKSPVFTPKIRPKYAQNRPVLWGNNPMVGATVACAVAVEEAMK